MVGAGLGWGETKGWIGEGDGGGGCGVEAVVSAAAVVAGVSVMKMMEMLS